MYRYTKAVLVLATVLLLPVSIKAAVEPSPREATKSQVESTLKFVSSMLTTSSVAQSIRKSNFPPAMAYLMESGKLHTQAQDKFAANNYSEASKLLDESIRLILEAGRLAVIANGKDEKLKNDFEARLRSIKSLLEAEERISTEKERDDIHSKLQEQVTPLLKEAEDLAAQNNYRDGRNALDQAYLLVKISIEQMRSGDTLIRELKFETAEEEYNYELDRNDTYRMLLDMILAENEDLDKNPRVKRMIDKSVSLRQLAEKQAAEGDFETGIKTLENATRSIIHALRNAGFFIPG